MKIYQSLAKGLALCILPAALLAGCSSDASYDTEVSEMEEVSAHTETSGNGEISGDASETAVDGEGAQDAQAVDVSVSADTSEMFTERDLNASYDESTAARITLDPSGSSCDSDAIVIGENTVTITDEGTYILSGTLDAGMVIVDARDSDKVWLVLDQVSISNDTSAALYVREADKVVITLAEGSENSLYTQGNYEAIDDNNIDSAVFSKADLTINGSGTLNVTAEIGHGIVSKDDLVITGGTLTISSANHGLSANDSVRITNGALTIISGKDGIQAENTEDASLGFVYIQSGTFQITSGDDGAHGDDALSISGGELTITESYEGLEGLSITISGGTIDIVSSDDGLNAAGGNDESGFMAGPGRPDDFASEDTESMFIEISGGTLYVNASGDGMDSNGSIRVSGGAVYISGPTDGANGALDYASSVTMTGGTLIAAGSSGMAESFSDASTQGVIMVNVDSQETDSLIQLSDADGNLLLSWTAPKGFSNVVVSCPDIIQGNTYTLDAGSSQTSITMDSFVYNGGSGMGSSMPQDAGNMPGGRRR